MESLTPEVSERPAFVYLVRCADDTLYCGWTYDVEQRLAAHNDGRGAKYTRARRPVELVYTEAVANSRTARQREFAIKALTRRQKLALIASWPGRPQS